jgi:hypothetical protein
MLGQETMRQWIWAEFKEHAATELAATVIAKARRSSKTKGRCCKPQKQLKPDR